MIKRAFTFAFMLCAFSAPALAGDTATPRHVVELFTSQGCSSCPPANRFVSKISDDPGVLALSYGVTYWDYLGWKDTFGDKSFTQRQVAYRDAFMARNVYTPQIVLNGQVHSSRFSTREVLSAQLPKRDCHFKVENGALVLISNAPPTSKLVIVEFEPGEQSVKVKRGENNGRTLTLANVVKSVRPTRWSGKRAKLDLDLNNGRAYAALFHDPETAEITAAVTYMP